MKMKVKLLLRGITVEYYFGARVWPVVLLAGMLITLTSLLMPTFTLSTLLGILGGSVMWGATELPGQEESGCGETCSPPTPGGRLLWTTANESAMGRAGPGCKQLDFKQSGHNVATRESLVCDQNLTAFC